ncbi:Ebp2-domain-containing protein [Coniochaeta ligniaria NRRL 30616]|uniref:Ebp2-domain-containing protein n=1 Tax=Coniochaeta ligniaria NRRL 30616 TaxID=1408157 RepID=A0A1J7IR52_9PEZI|nr:Ebp2-domain-containing protein [Coniochaeta ligniaria NRRL 30616]
MAKSRLLSALAAEKGVDVKKVLQKRKQKETSRRKRREGLPDTRNLKKPQQKKKAQPEAELESDDDDEDWEEEEDSDSDNDMSGLIDDEAEEGDSDEEESDEEGKLDLAKFEHDESSSESEVEMEAKIERPKKGRQATDLPKPKADKSQLRKAAAAQSDSEDSDPEEDSDIDLEDLEDLSDAEREDLVPHTRTTINNHTALLAALSRIALPQGPSVPFATHQSVVSSKPTAEAIEDIQDDLQRELAFYAQALEAAKLGRAKLLKEGVPFTRPNDYFAEMVKNDGQMEKVKARLVEEATNKKAAAEARKQRDLKKFGKQVQVAKEQERAKAKRETLEKIKTLKRKRSESGAAAGEREAIDFDVAVEDEIKGADKKRAGAGKRDGPAAKRHKKDSKFGFGGKKRHAKSNDAVSAGDLGGFSVKRMKAGGGGKGKTTPRLGKNKRKAAAGKR